MSQLQLPGHLGGLFLTNPLIKLEVAHLSSVAASWHPTYQWLLEKGYEASLAANSIDTHAATRSLQALAKQHIYVSAAGEICSQYTPSPLLSFDTPLGACVHALQGKLTNCLYHNAALQIWYEADEDGRARFLSCMGNGDGASFRDPSKKLCLHFDDEEFPIICALRVGAPLCGPMLCQNNSASGRTCSLPLDVLHFLSCKLGGGVSLLHKCLAAQLVNIVKDLLATPRIEVPVPEFSSASTGVVHCDADDGSHHGCHCLLQ